MTRYFMSYGTANDTDFFADFMNFRRMSRMDPGVDRVELVVSISEVRPKNSYDLKIVKKLERLVEKNPKIVCRDIGFKSNIGRDFSSAARALRFADLHGTDDDYILFSNRSGYGPFSSSWYKKYVQLLEERGASLVGSTINGSGHPNGKSRGFSPHVQTYAYLGKVGKLRPFVKDFPAENIVDRTALIDEGEVRLSKDLLAEGGGIACLAWPDELFTNDSTDSSRLLGGDMKTQANGLPFLYKRRLKRQVLGRAMFEAWRIL